MSMRDRAAQPHLSSSPRRRGSIQASDERKTEAWMDPGLRRDDGVSRSVPARLRESLLLPVVLICALISTFAHAADRLAAPHLGKPMTAGEAAKWDLSVFPDGKGLPEGKGTAADGKSIFVTQCASCHGDGGRGATAEELVAEPQPLTEAGASKAIGPYWPYATTPFDFIRRSMPAGAPGSLSSDDVYAVTAYLLAANGVISETDEMNATTLPAVKMPNRDGFDWIDVKH